MWWSSCGVAMLQLCQSPPLHKVGKVVAMAGFFDYVPKRQAPNLLRFGGRSVFGSFGSPFFGSQEPRHTMTCMDPEVATGNRDRDQADMKKMLCVMISMHLFSHITPKIYRSHCSLVYKYNTVFIHVMLPCVTKFVVSFCVMFLLIASTLVHVIHFGGLGHMNHHQFTAWRTLTLLLQGGVNLRILYIYRSERSLWDFFELVSNWIRRGVKLINQLQQIAQVDHRKRRYQFSFPWWWWNLLGLTTCVVFWFCLLWMATRIWTRCSIKRPLCRVCCLESWRSFLPFLSCLPSNYFPLNSCLPPKEKTNWQQVVATWFIKLNKSYKMPKNQMPKKKTSIKKSHHKQHEVAVFFWKPAPGAQQCQSPVTNRCLASTSCWWKMCPVP